MPPASPAWTRLQYRSSKTLGCRRRASLKVEPVSTDDLTSRSTPEKILLSVCPARMSRHCTMGRPASIIVANNRVKVTRSLVLTPEPMVKVSCLLFFLTRVGVRFCCRRRALTASSVSASMRPFLISPVRARASQTNSAISAALAYRLQSAVVKSRVRRVLPMTTLLDLESAETTHEVAQRVVSSGVAHACAAGWARIDGAQTKVAFGAAFARGEGAPLDVPAPEQMLFD